MIDFCHVGGKLYRVLGGTLITERTPVEMTQPEDKVRWYLPGSLTVKADLHLSRHGEEYCLVGIFDSVHWRSVMGNLVAYLTPSRMYFDKELTP